MGRASRTPRVDPPAPEGRILATLGAHLFTHPFSTAHVLMALGLGAGSLVLLRHLLLERLAFGRSLLQAFHRTEISVLALIVLGMVVFSATQVLFRNLARAGIVWIDPLLRYLTLWIAFVGGAVATREGRHIQMDVLGRVLPPSLRRFVSRITHFAAAATCMVLAESAYRHLASEYAHGEREFLQIPTWILLGVIPLTLALMTYRFLDRALFPPPEATLPEEPSP